MKKVDSNVKFQLLELCSPTDLMDNSLFFHAWSMRYSKWLIAVVIVIWPDLMNDSDQNSTKIC